MGDAECSADNLEKGLRILARIIARKLVREEMSRAINSWTQERLESGGRLSGADLPSTEEMAARR